MKSKLFFEKYLYFVLAALLAAYYLLSPRTGVYDWEKEIFYIQFIKESIFNLKALPIFLWNNNGLGNYPVIGQSNLFFGNPETLLFSPWIFMTAFLNPVTFYKLFYIIHLAFAVIGLILLTRRLGWSNLQSRIFSGLFLLSPIILQHLAIGYTPWVNLFLFPMLLYFQLLEKRSVSVIGSAMIFSLIVLQGGIHIAVWLLGFMFLLKLSQACLFKRFSALLDLFGIMLLSGLLAFARIYFSFITLHDFWQPSFPGFSISAFLQMALKLPLFFSGDIDDIERYFEFKIDGLPYWDAGVYWGPFLIFVLSLIAFTLLKSKKRGKSSIDKNTLSILVSSLGILILSFRKIFSSMAAFLSRSTGILAFEGVEKYPFRFSLIAFYGLSLWFAVSGVQFIQNIHGPRFESTRRQLTFSGSAIIRKRLFSITAVLSCIFGLSLIFWFAWGQRILLDEIRYAFYGRGLPVLEKMMANKEILSVGAYLNKALTLSNWLTCFMAALFVLCVIGSLYIRYSEYSQKFLRNSFNWFYKNRMVIVEILMIAPLVIASLSWMRVATATPISQYERTLVIEPELIATSPEGAIIDISHSAPDGLHLKCEFSHDQVCKVILPIKESELRFFEIIPSPIHTINLGESQMLTLKPDLIYQLSFDSTSFFIPILITLINWSWLGVLLVKTLRKPEKLFV